MDNFKELKILIVDDLQENIIALSAVLKKQGYHTISAKSGDEALSLLKKNSFGIILLDVQMPVMNGFELAEKIKQNPSTQSIPILFLTANEEQPELKLKGLKAGGLDYLTKPINPDLLQIKINNLLNLSFVQQQLREANRRLTEKAKLSEDTFENFFYSSPDEIFILSEEGLITRINRSGKLSMGIYASELIGKNIRELPFELSFLSGIHPDHLHSGNNNLLHQNETIRAFEAIMKNGVKGNLAEVQLKDASGRKRYYEISGNIFHTANLERFLQLNVREVTIRQKYKSELEASEQRMKEAQRIAHLGGWEKNVKHDRLFWSEELYRILEIDSSKCPATYEAYWNAIHPNDRSKMKEVYEQSLLNKKPYKLKYRLRFPDGRIKFVEEQCESFFDANGNVTKSIGTLQDITEKVKQDAEMKVKEDAIATSINAISFADTSGNITYTNKAFNDLWGYSSEEIANMKTVDFWLNKEEAKLRMKALEKNGSNVDEADGIRKNGEIVRVRISANVVKDEAGNAICYMGAFIDLTKKRKAEMALQKSEDRYRKITETTQEMIGTLSAEGILTWVNRAWLNNTEFSGEEIIGKHLSQLMDEVSNHKFRTSLPNILKGNAAFVKRTFICKSGKKIFVEGNIIPLIEDNAIIGTQAFLRNVSARVEAEQKLIKSTEKLIEAQRIAKLGSWELDLVTNELTWSDEVYRIAEIEPAAYQPSYIHLFNSIHPEDRDRVISTYRQSLKTKLPYRIKYRLLFESNRIKYIEEQCESFFNEKGMAIKSVGTVQDITEKEIAEEKIRISEERFNLAMRGANDGLWDYNVLTGKVYYSPRYISMLGYNEMEFGDDRTFWESQIHPEDRARTVNFLSAFVEGTIPEYHQEFRMRHKMGYYVYVLSRGIALRNDAGEIYRMVGTHTDITERNEILKRIQDTELFTRGILDSLTSNIAVVDENGWILVTNHSWDEFSMSNGESNLMKTGVGANYFEACKTAYEMGDDISGKVLVGMNQVLSKKADSFQIEYPCHSEDEERWFLLTVTPYHSDAPKIVVRHIDITKRRNTQQKITRDSEILSGISDAVIYSDLDLNVIEWNSNATEIFGWNKKEVVGKNYPYALKFSYLKGMSKDTMIIQLIREGKCKVELVAQTKDARRIYIAMNVSLLKNSDGIPIGIISIIRDISERIAHEKALEVSELNYKELFEQSPYGVITLDTNGRIQSVNDKIADLTGFSKYKFIGKHLLKSPFKATPFGFETREIFEKILRYSGEDLTFEALIATSGNNEMHCEIKARYIKKIEKVSLIIRDVSALRNAEKFNRMLYNITSFANSATVNLDNFCHYLKNELAAYFNTDNFCVSNYNAAISELEFIYYNDGLQKQEDAPPPRRNFNGLTEYVIRHARPLLLINNELQHFYREHKIEITGEKSKCWMGVPLITGSDSVGAIAVQSYRNKAEYNEHDLEVLIRIASIVAPIIEKLKNDQKLWLINSAIEGAGDGVFITNPELENNPIVFVNQKYTQLTGYSTEEIYGNNLEMLFGAKSARQIMAKIKESFEQENSFHGEIMYYRKDGTSFWSDISINPVKNKAGETSNFIGILKDISQKKDMEKLLIEKNKELELFMYRASHDLKGPLSTNKGLLRFAVDECRDNNMLHYLQMMQKSNEKLENILSDLMEIVIIREGTIEKTPVVLDELIKEIVESAEAESNKKDEIKLIVDLNVKGKVSIDVKLMKIILRNIISNAIKYSNTGAENAYVNISTAIEDNQLMITVADNGIGINSKYLTKVFDMFFRATDSASGTGLGLYIVKNAIDKMGGTILLNSTEKVGTFVTVKIPL